MKKRIVLVILSTILLFFCGCSSKITHGEVCGKQHRASTTKVIRFPLIISNGKTTTTIMIPYVVRYPDRYVIIIRSFEDDEWVTEDFYVSKEVYDQINIGDMFEYDESRGDLADEPYTKEKQ